jgi:hypothetical protein
MAALLTAIAVILVIMGIALPGTAPQPVNPGGGTVAASTTGK